MIPWLEKNIAGVERLIRSERIYLERNPGSFNATVTVLQAENLLIDLQEKLMEEKEKAEAMT